MTIFAVLMPMPQRQITELIEDKFSSDYLRLNETQYLVSFRGTAVDLSRELGLYDPKKPDEPPTGSAIVLSTSSYFGRAPNTVWDWMKSKLEASSSG